MRDPKERFTDRVEEYVRHRPGYPRGLLHLLMREHGLGPGRVVADIGSGTGILSRLLLESGARVLGVEPNRSMRAAAERDLGGEARFRSIEGSAEATALDAASVDLVTAGQAFHWFDPARARAEFRRVLRAGGAVVLTWNARKSTPFNDDYEDMLDRLAPDYPAVRARDRAIESVVQAFFAPHAPRVEKFPNGQVLDEADLRGRLLSSSYVPRPGQPMHDAVMQRASEIFAAHARDGRVELAYDTVVYRGELG
jgi:SAM-dependent methyltransferase